MRVVVVGGSGQVARALAERAAGDASLDVVVAGRPTLDVTKPETVRAAIHAARPDLVIDAAAYTAVDKAESEPERAFAVNRDGAAAVAAAAAEVGAPVVWLSTDYVFDGAKTEPYGEGDPTNPTSVYGASKLAGEQAVAAANPRHLILRTSWVFAPYGQNFLRTMLRLAAERPSLRVVDDQIGCPTYAPDLADALFAIARRPFAPGVAHLAGPDAVSWCGFARKIVAASARRGGPSVPVEAIATADYPTPARRPANSRLDSTKARATLGVALPALDDALGRCLDRLLAGAEQAA
jgi:dTDP-4-dehydrorhamnose reductase